MGKVTVFTRDGCSHCHRVKDLLRARGAEYMEISLTTEPEWKPLLYIMSGGCVSTPQVFFNDCHIGGTEEIERMEKEGTLARRLKECEEEEEINFPPPIRKPKSREFLKVIPAELRSKWQNDLEALDSKLGGTADHPISSLLLMLETPNEMVVVCTAGPGRKIYSVGAGGKKDRDKKLYCQVAIENKATLFVTDPLKIPGLEKNEDWVKFGYGYYLGAPWIVGQTRGTIAVMEKKPDILKTEHIVIVEALRDEVERDLTTHRQQGAQS